MSQQLQQIIDNAWDNRASLSPTSAPKEVADAVEHVVADLNNGHLRVATREGVGRWTVHQWIKKAVLLSFRLKDNEPVKAGDLAFFDKVPTKFAHLSPEEMAATGVRVVPPAVARRGSFIAKGAVLMPSYVNIGAYVDEGTMVDTWATVGSCAQIGRNVHLSGGVGIGGVLEPLQANPTIIEDNCFIGARSEVVEGVIVEENSVLSMGVYIGQSTPIYDRTTGETTYGRIPAGSVVISGALPRDEGRYSLYAAIIVKRVDAQTRAKTSINDLLRRNRNDLTEEPTMGTMERILRLMAEKKASDVYLTAHAPAQIRIDGQCVPINNQSLPPDATRALIAEVLPAARIDELDRTGELNMGVTIEGAGSFRFSAMRQRGSVAAVIRYIPPDIPALDTLNVPMVLAELIMEKRGLLLMVGATGAGKSTTLASMIDYRNERMPGHILTIEDPIEFAFRNKRSVVNQREVGTDTESLHIALKNALRQAPDVILIGEIRDRETMSQALAYAQSGHLCMATMHASNSYQALNRILSFYPVEVRPTLLGDLATGLKAIISQRLLRTVVGGRTPAVEVLLNSQLISELILKGEFGDIRESMEKSLAEGSQTFEQDIARLITEDIVDRKEGMLHADSPNNLLWRLANDFTSSKPVMAAEDEADDQPSFTEITLDVKQ